MKRLTTTVLVTAGVVVTILLAAYYQQMAPLKRLDSVLLYQSSLSVVEDGRPVSTINASWPSAYPTFVSPADEVCQADLRMTGPSEYNILETHASTFAVYPIALLTLVAAPETAFALLNARHPSAPLRHPGPRVMATGGSGGRRRVRRLGWRLPSLVAFGGRGLGVDRLYMAFALLSLFGMDAVVNRGGELHDTRWLAAWASVTVAAALFTEHAAVMMIGVTVFFVALFPAVRRSTKAVVTLVGLAVILTLYVYWYFDVVRVPAPGTGNLIANLDLHLLDTLQKPEAAAFLSVNVLLAGALVAFFGTPILRIDRMRDAAEPPDPSRRRRTQWVGHALPHDVHTVCHLRGCELAMAIWSRGYTQGALERPWPRPFACAQSCSAARWIRTRARRNSLVALGLRLKAR